MNAIVRERLTYSVLSLLFLILIWFCPFSKVDLFSLALLALATFRLSRMVSTDKIFWYRYSFIQEFVNNSGSYTMPSGIGVRGAIGELILCPICTGTWVALGLYYGLVYLPVFTNILILVMAIAGLVEIAVKVIK